MIRFPNAKINLGLYITNRRDDGYHDLETVFYPIPLTDILEIIPAKDEARMYLSGKVVSGDKEDNLVWKAYHMLKEEFPLAVQPLETYLHKSIPMGAGMGGGSADGAFMLSAINDRFNIGLSKRQLAEMALRLGSDCPFFIYNTPHFASGRGERLEPVEIDLSGFSMLIICPQIHVATGNAFQMITPKPAQCDLRKLAELPVVEWKDHIGNDFEEPVFKLHPELKDIKDQLYHHGAVYASMSGSGSTVYGLFYKQKKAVIESSVAFESFYIE